MSQTNFKLLHIKDVAERLNISSATAYELVNKGLLISHRIGPNKGVIRIKEEDLTAYITNCRNSISPAIPKIAPAPMTLNHIKLRKAK